MVKRKTGNGGYTMRLIRVSILCLLSLANLNTAFAQVEPAVSAMPANSFQFTGTWDCAGSFRNGKVHRSTFRTSVILQGKWLELAEQDIEPATGYVAKYLIGYDPQQKQLIEFDANNFGTATYRSEQGWKSGVLMMSSPVTQDAKAPYVADRFVYSIADPDTFRVDWQVRRNLTSEWSPADQQVCKRRMGG
jgi:hypothetical protein